MTVSTCGRCGVLVDVDAKRCPQCGRLYPALFGLRRVMDRMFPLGSHFSKPLVMGLVVVYLLTVLVSRKVVGTSEAGGFSAFSPDVRVLVFYFGAHFTQFILEQGQWWRLITACLLHGGLIHLLFNGMALFQLGPLIEQAYGPARFTILFVLTGIAGYLASLPFVMAPSIGASGAVFGLIGAAIAYGKRRGGTHGQTIRDYGIRWLVYGLAFGFLVSGINNYAHAGGALAGFGIAWFFDVYRTQRGRESDAARIGALACGLLVLVAIGLAVQFALTVEPG